MYKNAIFDVDGTLIDSSVGVCGTVAYVLDKMKKPALPPEKLRLFVGPSLFDGFTSIAGFTAEEAKTAIKIYRDDYVNKGLYECKVFGGYPELFEKLLKNGVTLSAASTKPQRFLTPLFEKLGFTKYFERVIGPCDEACSSDKTEYIKAAMTDTNAVMIGDRKYDILSARKANVDAIGVTYGFAEDGEFEKFKPDYIAANADELFDIIILNERQI